MLIMEIHSEGSSDPFIEFEDLMNEKKRNQRRNKLWACILGMEAILNIDFSWWQQCHQKTQLHHNGNPKRKRHPIRWQMPTPRHLGMTSKHVGLLDELLAFIHIHLLLDYVVFSRSCLCLVRCMCKVRKSLWHKHLLT